MGRRAWAAIKVCRMIWTCFNRIVFAVQPIHRINAMIFMPCLLSISLDLVLCRTENSIWTKWSNCPVSIQSASVSRISVAVFPIILHHFQAPFNSIYCGMQFPFSTPSGQMCTLHQIFSIFDLKFSQQSEAKWISKKKFFFISLLDDRCI